MKVFQSHILKPIMIGLISIMLSTFTLNTYAIFGVGDIVYDPANHQQAELNYAQQVATVKHLADQITQMKKQYEAITGTRPLGQILNDPSLRNYLPDEWAGIYDKVKSGQIKGITSKYSSIANAEGFDPNAKGGQKRYQDTLIANKAMTMEAYDQTTKRLNNILALMKKADATQDTKEAADLQNRIVAENAMIQNEQTRLNLMMQLQQAELRLAEEQRNREFNKRFFGRP